VFIKSIGQTYKKEENEEAMKYGKINATHTTKNSYGKR
jgi:hypothetical protein